MAHPVVQRSTSRRRPYPYDMYIGDVRVMLQPDADGNLVSQKTKTLDATAPVDYTYSSANPFKERTFEFTKLYGGFGQYTEDQDRKPHRYEHGEFLDSSINGMQFKGPNFEDHVETIAVAAGQVRQIIKALHGGTEVVFAICQTGVWRRTSDGSWTASLTQTSGGTALPAGQDPQQALRFKSRTAAKADCLYVACAAGNLWEYNGATWTQAAATEGPGTGVANGEARCIERVQDELWVAGDYWVVKTTDAADPLLRASWAGVIYVGDQTCKITWLKQIQNTLFIFKEDGIYTLSDTGESKEILSLRGANNRRNGRNASVWLDRMWISFNDKTFTISPTGELRPDGLEQVLENQSVIRGRWAAGAPHNTWFMYEIYYNPGTDDSHLIKHGTWVESTVSDSLVPGLAQFADAHHGALYTWDNKEATCAEVVSDIHTSSNDRLYVGFDDGTVEWCVLPLSSPNPTIDSNCEFTGHQTYTYLPVHHMGYQADNKLYRGISAVGPKLTNTEWVEIEYRFDTVNTFATWTTLDPDNPAFTLPNDRKEFPNNTYARHIQMRIKFVKDPSSGDNQTPIIDGIAVHEALRPSFALEYVCSARLASFLPKHNGTVDRRRGSQIRNEILSACADPGNVSITLPTGEVEWMTLIDYRESAANWSKRRDHEWLIQLTGIQLRTYSQASPGFSGLTYTTLETYTLGELESII